jgi:dihydroorotate dehydrogenase (NAD+) catalytic subunit
MVLVLDGEPARGARLSPVSLPTATERPASVDLSVRIGSLKLSNPIIAASGTFGYGVEFVGLVDLNRLGGIVVKGLSALPMEGAPAPRLCETAAGMVNAVGLQNIGVRAFVAEKLPLLRRYTTAIVANVFGRTIAEYAEVIRVLEDAEGLSAYELNISCPNVDHGGAEFGSDPALVAEVVAAARKASKRPLWVKLAPHLVGLDRIAQATEEAGADALTVANTYPALCINPRTQTSRLGSFMGGLSGPAIKPITLRLVFEVSKAVKIPIIGLGGIEIPEDVVEYVLAGATAVQVGTAHFADPRASERLVEGVREYCGMLKVSKILSLRGNLESKLA